MNTGGTRSSVTRRHCGSSSSADARGVTLRVVGGVAVALHTQGEVHPALRRPYRDIDLVTRRKGDREALKVLIDAGYESNERFNSMVGAHNRLVVYDNPNQRQLDVFVGEFRMCHWCRSIASDADSPTVPLAELLVTKLQIVKMNEKDSRTSSRSCSSTPSARATTRRSTPVASPSCRGRLGALAHDEGARSSTYVRARPLALEDAERDLVRQRLDQLWERVEGEPKSMRFKARARVGDRTRWYEEPDEVGHRELDGEADQVA